MTQRTLFDAGQPQPDCDEYHMRAAVPLARTTDPETSKAGAADVMPRAGSMKARVLEAFQLAERNMTAQECVALLSAQHPELMKTQTAYATFRRRVHELKAEGRLQLMGERRCGVSGKRAEFYSLVKKGKP